MPTSMTDVLRRVVDNANLGKVVTDVGPGFALSVPILMLLALWTGVSVMPADRLKRLDADIETARRAVWEVKAGFGSLLTEVPGLQAACPPGTDEAAAERCYALAARTIAGLGTEVEAYTAAMKDRDKNRQEIEQRLAPFKRASDRLLAQKEVLEANVARLQSLENMRADAESLEFNLVTFTANTAAFIAFAVVLGILVSQISHYLLIDVVYARFPAVIAAEKPPISIAQLLSKQDEELVTHYFRYTEGAINMIVPVILVGFVFPLYARQRLSYDISFGWSVLLTAALAVILAISGYKTYLSFVKKRKALAEAVAANQVVLVPKIPPA